MSKHFSFLAILIIFILYIFIQLHRLALLIYKTLFRFTMAFTDMLPEPWNVVIPILLIFHILALVRSITLPQP